MLATVPNTVIVGFPLLEAMYGPDSLPLVAQIVVVQVVLWFPFLQIALDIAQSLRKPERRPTEDSESNFATLQSRQSPSIFSLAARGDRPDREMLQRSTATDPCCSNHRHVAVARIITEASAHDSRESAVSGAEGNHDYGSANRDDDREREEGRSLETLPIRSTSSFFTESPADSAEAGSSHLDGLEPSISVVIQASGGSAPPRSPPAAAALRRLTARASGQESESPLRDQCREQTQKRPGVAGDGVQDVIEETKGWRCVPAGSNCCEMEAGANTKDGRRPCPWLPSSSPHQSDQSASRLPSGPSQSSNPDGADGPDPLEGGNEEGPASPGPSGPSQSSNPDPRSPRSSGERRLWVVCVKAFLQGRLMWAGLVGMAYSLLASRYGFDMPTPLEKTVTMLSNMCLGLSMISLGMFTALEGSLVPIGWWNTTWTFSLRLLWEPALAGIITYLFGCRGRVLKVAIIQSALPQAVITFVLASQFGVHPDVLSTSVGLGTLVSLPLLIVYYLLLELLV
ncbi:hypothetical protein CBR_g29962 [Chara braunii]|uniref:Auxin efflux carrier component n=1 Tax=Chara braunii TaxID=69332 RepID=A0A388LBL6_CHABU|nr:hypothetical protein CBR_g29962 [Chara braunii]|eukprot:GBG79698.1 hypothetical protein CBR_g29962 [Chara braunii]